MQKLIQSLLGEEKLNIVDVGSTGGPELRWRKWENACFFYTFDPDPRAQSWSSTSKNFPVGLWSHRCSQTIHLASYPPASSLFKPNQEFLSAFSVQSAMQEVGTKKIELHTLDQILNGHPIDFLKIDAEGAELEILKGATHTLNQQCLGMQLEALFCPIRQNAPSFNDLDTFAKNFDLQLFHIQREHWMRKNKISAYVSNPQLIWGNVLYLLPKRIFLKKLKQSDNPKLLLGKYLLILLAYNLFDYAYELCEEVSFEETEKLKEVLQGLSLSKKEVVKLVFSLLVGAGKYGLCFSTKSKQNRLSYLKRKVRDLGTLCLYLGKNDFALYD